MSVGKWVAAYDVVQDGRRARVADLLSTVGSRIERSVFVIELRDSDASAFSTQLGALLDLHTDAIHMFRLCANCERDSLQLGQALLPPDDDCWIVL